MLIMRGPGGFAGGRASDALVSHIDLFPTICDVASIERPEWLQGESLVPLVNGEAEEVREAIFAEKTYHVAYEPERCVRTHRWKYIRHYGERRMPVLANVDDGPSKDLLIERGWAERPIASEQLYDLTFNPNETRNMADDPSVADVLEEMCGRLENWMAETEDPLLDGPVPAPAGAELNTPDQLSADDPVTVV
jgi:arylsulfatase A-like enzyme